VSVAEATVEIKNRLGLHLRAASTLAQAVAKFSSQVTIARGKNQVSARSVTSLMMLGAGHGAKLRVRAEGPDAKEALKAVQGLFEQGFGED
jgi:phosphocarrier protein HPr